MVLHQIRKFRFSAQNLVISDTHHPDENILKLGICGGWGMRESKHKLDAKFWERAFSRFEK